jgi:hypothetical protein
MSSLLLIYPPVAKNCEPPAGLARLAGFLRGNGVPCGTFDANRAVLDYLLQLDSPRQDTWSLRARKNLKANLAGLQRLDTYASNDRYKRMVADVNRVLTGVSGGVELSLGNYQDQFSPVKSTDLRLACEHFQESLFYPFYDTLLSQVIEEQQPDYIGLSITYLSQASPAFSLIGFLRHRYPHLKIVIGGGLVTSWMRGPLWADPFTDLVDESIAGSGELPLLHLLRPEALSPSMAPPQYDDVDYLAPGFILPYAASSGCYWNKCLFCPETAEENPYAAVSADQVLGDVNGLVVKHKPVLVHFLDNAVSPSLMKRFIATPIGAPWYGFARVSDQLARPEFCLALRKSGCVMLKLGLESGDQQVLDAMDKGIELPLVAAVLKSLKAAGILTYVYLLFGTPSEDEASARRTLDFTVEHQAEIGFLNLAVFNLPVGSPEASGLAVSAFYGGDLSLYTDFNHPKGWSRRLVRQFLNKEFKRHPAIAPILQRDPPLFTSNHAPFFHRFFSG